MTPSPTPWQVGTQCSRDCRDWAREQLTDEEYAAYVASSLKIFRDEADRLARGEVLRAVRAEGADE